MAESLFYLSIILVLLASTPSTQAFSRTISREELGLKAQTQTHLHLFFHDVVSGPNPTAIRIAQANSTSQSKNSFGSLAMIDDPLTSGPENTSKLLGRAQGMYGLADQNDAALIMVMNFAFMDGDFKGSTLSVLGRNPVNQGVRELPVIGGTGTFRFAQGYAQAKTHTFDQKTGDAVVEYDMYVSHSDSSDGQKVSGPSGSGGEAARGGVGRTGLTGSFVGLLFFVYFLNLF